MYRIILECYSKNKKTTYNIMENMKMTNEQIMEISKLISTASMEDLQTIREMTKARYDIISRTAKFAFVAGTAVTFEAKGYTYVGKVEKVMQKNIKVRATRVGDTKPMVWTVSPQLLKRA